ncbi:MAG: 5-(carboxyamino)imidazole ribonucleotide synthase [Gammaproteobacteria bacterium]|nr:5-(carboxyamino)imidazole ribonucleotide synthase [Gammaproteobacteria bacterium]MCP5202330.1 5-(carboxyamino)imidazole ribonucleotide synthase [Gammaproteobacteria bacterium]
MGIAGGGQLAQMMLPAAAELGLAVVVLDPDPQCSAAGEAQGVVVGEFQSAAALRELAGRCDVLTFEIERINAAALAELEAEGHVVRPSAATLATIQDKLEQKRFLARHDIPTSAFAAWESGTPLPRALPCVWKARRDGYDGRGVAILRDQADVAALPQAPALIEALVDIDYELAVLVARGHDGTLLHYPVVEIVMDDAAHVMDTVVAPAVAPAAVMARVRELATRVAEAFDYVGILALEFFVGRDGAVLVNEVSPRPHNSGHYTIEACATSQFEQHLRAVAGLPLGSTALRGAAVTFNVLGAPGARGRPCYLGFDRDDADVFVHCYDKPEVRPGRKMAHVTVLAGDRDAALARAAAIKPGIRVEGSNV